MGLIRLFSLAVVAPKLDLKPGIDAGIFPESTSAFDAGTDGGFGAPARAQFLRHPPSWHRSRPSL